MSQPSMSASALLLECAYSFGRNDLSPREPGEPARYGSAFHELLAAAIMGGYQDHGNTLPVAAKWGFAGETAGPVAGELRTHVGESLKALTKWLDPTNNPFGLDLRKAQPHVEESIALTPGVSARRIDAPSDDTHHYAGLKPGEMPGTSDLRYAPKGKPIVVLDHKTGEWEDFSEPLSKPQLLSLGAAAVRVTAGRRPVPASTPVILGVLHARRRGMPKVYADKTTMGELASHERKLGLQLARVGDGSMRPGAWCTDLYCPARSVCPARDAELLARSGDVLTGLTAAGGALSKDGLTANDLGPGATTRLSPVAMTVEKKLGHLYEVAQKAEQLVKRVREEIKQSIITSKGRLLPQTSKGKYVTVRSFKRETISKTSFVEVYGKLEAERKFKKLREDGVMKITEVDQLHLESDEGE